MDGVAHTGVSGSTAIASHPVQSGHPVTMPPQRLRLADEVRRFGYDCIRRYGKSASFASARDADIEAAIGALPQRYQLFVDLRFGLYDGLSRTFVEIAADVAAIEGSEPVSDQRSRDIVQRAISKIGRYLRLTQGEFGAWPVPRP